MANEERYCSNCRAELPAKAEACPACGVFAGDMYDERMHRPPTRYTLFGSILAIALVAGGAAIWWNAQRGLPDQRRPALETPRVRVVRPGGAQRAPGAAVNQAEAIRLVRKHIVETSGVKSDCIMLLGDGFSKGAYIVKASDRCADTRLGRWRVDGKSGEVTRAR